MGRDRTLKDLETIACATLLEGLTPGLRDALASLHRQGATKAGILSLVEGAIRAEGRDPRLSLLRTACDYYLDTLIQGDAV